MIGNDDKEEFYNRIHYIYDTYVYIDDYNYNNNDYWTFKKKTLVFGVEPDYNNKLLKRRSVIVFNTQFKIWAFC